MSRETAPRPSRSGRRAARTVPENWERLVRATLQREQLRNVGQVPSGRPSEGIAGGLPPSLVSTNIDHILQAANEIEDDDPNVARIRELFLFFWLWCLKIGARALEMKKVYATLKALLDVLEVLVGESDTSELGRRIKEEVPSQNKGTTSFCCNVKSSNEVEVFLLLRLANFFWLLVKDISDSPSVMVISSSLRIFQVKKMGKSDATLRAELTPYNIVPVDAPSLTNAISFFPEVCTFSFILLL
ncbi:hypothetical protein ZIOFF_035794 [Zingiber officinale]|uniref:Uncharacterized protein n=1 Tax=Zingiber officinale TaxID=94328 RepID=A0A8J5GH38_ZINOF|nr:hypothetical protein ZIOFF_035794 [Zingiber officinale]